uniref:Uncharacterized protein n=1 Tax=Aegilops tauschii subsp. strangulata TaxID=200361 RepID=A0A453KBA2_AEGTS
AVLKRGKPSHAGATIIEVLEISETSIIFYSTYLLASHHHGTRFLFLLLAPGPTAKRPRRWGTEQKEEYLCSAAHT